MALAAITPIRNRVAPTTYRAEVNPSTRAVVSLLTGLHLSRLLGITCRSGVKDVIHPPLESIVPHARFLRSASFRYSLAGFKPLYGDITPNASSPLLALCVLFRTQHLITHCGVSTL